MPRPDRTKAGNDRASKAAKIQKAGAAKERRRGFLIWGSAAVVILAIVGVVTGAIIRDSPALVELSGVEEYDTEAANHTGEPVDYEQSPGVGGPHHPAWWNCGVYPEPVPQEHGVHSLEHGAVWLSYQPDLPADQIETLESLGGEAYMLVSPNPDQESPVMVTSWNRQMALDTVDDRVLRAYIREYKQGPDTPEPLGACTGGTVTDRVTRS